MSASAEKIRYNLLNPRHPRIYPSRFHFFDILEIFRTLVVGHESRQPGLTNIKTGHMVCTISLSIKSAKTLFMKDLIAISLLLFSPILYAQTNNAVKPADGNPKINISPATSTKITNQPASIPNSNTNPTTGTVIKLKTKNAARPKPQDKSKIDSPPVLNKADSIPIKSQNKSARKMTTKKNKSQ